MIRLVAVDMDGTLLHDDKTYDHTIYEVYHQMKQKGILLVIASGKQYEALQHIFKDIKDELVYISENGAKIMYQEQVLYLDTMDFKDVKKVTAIIEKYPSCMAIACGHKHAYVLNAYYKNKDLVEKTLKNYRFVDSFDTLQDDILKFSIFDCSSSISNTAFNIQSELPSHLKLQVTGEVWLDISNVELSKGNGILLLQEYFGISKDECMAFGDAINDYEMLLHVKESYAMANSDEEIKKVAKHLCLSNNEDGVVKVLKEVLMKY